MSDEDMSYEDADSLPNPNSRDLIDTIAQLEQRLQKALASIDSYQTERGKLIDKILELRLRLQNVVDLLEK
jgi:regulator of replication initiation timing